VRRHLTWCDVDEGAVLYCGFARRTIVRDRRVVRGNETAQFVDDEGVVCSECPWIFRVLFAGEIWGYTRDLPGGTWPDDPVVVTDDPVVVTDVTGDPVVDNYQPRTELGRMLINLRREYVAAGGQLGDADDAERIAWSDAQSLADRGADAERERICLLLDRHGYGHAAHAIRTGRD